MGRLCSGVGPTRADIGNLFDRWADCDQDWPMSAIGQIRALFDQCLAGVFQIWRSLAAMTEFDHSGPTSPTFGPRLTACGRYWIVGRKSPLDFGQIRTDFVRLWGVRLDSAAPNQLWAVFGRGRIREPGGPFRAGIVSRASRPLASCSVGRRQEGVFEASEADRRVAGGAPAVGPVWEARAGAWSARGGVCWRSISWVA